MAENLGVVSSLLRFPVKSMLGEQLESAQVVERGVLGDREYALIDDETGKVVSVKRPKRWGRIFELTAATQDDRVVITFPDGDRMTVDDPALPDRLSAFLGRRVSVSSTPPPDARFEESWVRELKNDVEPYFGLPWRTVADEGDLIDAGQFMGPLGNFFNFGAVHVVTTSTTRRLAELAPGSRFDAHRFRPNIVVETDGEGFVETEWQGRTLSVGDVRLSVSFTVPRCVMTTLEQGDLPADPGVLQTIADHNSVDCFGTGTSYPCVGVYANVVDGGAISVGQGVSID
jgi:uncharacterized protein YcbX